MSRVGKLPIPIPQGVSFEVSQANHVTVKGPKGTLDLALDPDITVGQQDGELVVERPTDQ